MVDNIEDPPVDPEIPVEPESPEVPTTAPQLPSGYTPPTPAPAHADPVYEEFPEEELPLEAPVIDDGKIDAEGSVWRLYYLEGETPTEYQMRNLTGSVKATIITEPGETLSRITPQ